MPHNNCFTNAWILPPVKLSTNTAPNIDKIYISGAHVCFNDNTHPMAFPSGLLWKQQENEVVCALWFMSRGTPLLQARCGGMQFIAHLFPPQEDWQWRPYEKLGRTHEDVLWFSGSLAVTVLMECVYKKRQGRSASHYKAWEMGNSVWFPIWHPSFSQRKEWVWRLKWSSHQEVRDKWNHSFIFPCHCDLLILVYHVMIPVY